MIPLTDENPSLTFPFVTITIIVLNVLVFAYELTLNQQVLMAFQHTMGVVPVAYTHSITHPPVLSLVTNIFLHGGVLHLVSNMLFLWIFGNNIEDYLGHFRFLLFYLACGILASIAHIVTNVHSELPAIGASGAVSGVLAAYALLYPTARVVTLIFLCFPVLFTTVRIPAFLFIGFWIVYQILMGFSQMSFATTGGIAWFAHIGGFFAGLVLLAFLSGRRRRGVFSGRKHL